jgi:hypothetical protein
MGNRMDAKIIAMVKLKLPPYDLSVSSESDWNRVKSIPRRK